MLLEQEGKALEKVTTYRITQDSLSSHLSPQFSCRIVFGQILQLVGQVIPVFILKQSPLLNNKSFDHDKSGYSWKNM